MIDTRSTGNKSSGYMNREDITKAEVSEACLETLSNLQIMELSSNPIQHRQTVETLFKIV